MQNFSKLTARACALSSALCIPAVSFGAANLDVTVGADLELHDNAALTSSDKKSDLDRVARARVDFNDPDGALLTKLGYTIERHDYLRDIEPDRTVLDGASQLTWLALPRLLDFTISHQVSDQLQDRRAADVTSNQERRSILGASSNLYGHLSRVDTLILTPRITEVNLQRTNGSDSRHTAADLSWQHGTSAVSSFVLTGTREAVRFDDSINDYDTSRAMLSYKTKLSHLSYQVGGGYNRIKRDTGKDVNGFSAQIAADYTELSYSWGGSVVRQLTDSAIGLASVEQTITGFHGTDGNVDQFDIVESTQADLHGQRQLGASSTINASIGYVKQDYQTLPRDENSYLASLGYAYTINPAWSVTVQGSYERSRFPNAVNDLVYNDKQIDVFMSYRHSQRLSARFGIGRKERDANVSTSDYTDNFALMSVNFLIY